MNSLISTRGQALRAAGAYNLYEKDENGNNTGYFETKFPEGLPEYIKDQFDEFVFDFPSYPVKEPIPVQVCINIIESMSSENEDRDIFNDDGGYYITVSDLEKFFNSKTAIALTLDVDTFEGTSPVANTNWIQVLFLFNNEYAVSVFGPASTLTKELMEKFNASH